jgi:hypothetical protein
MELLSSLPYSQKSAIDSYFEPHESTSAPKMETECSSETLVSTYKSTQCYCPEDQHRHLHPRENLKSDVLLLFQRPIYFLIWVVLEPLIIIKYPWIITLLLLFSYENFICTCPIFQCVRCQLVLLLAVAVGGSVPQA